VTALAKHLVHVPELRVLDLGDNYISDGGAVALAAALVHLGNLNKLDLSVCNEAEESIGDEGAKALAVCLRNLHELKVSIVHPLCLDICFFNSLRILLVILKFLFGYLF
jgi:Ran GTPase-activating protein (RanGAP) involved in mRNA processing and transport